MEMSCATQTAGMPCFVQFNGVSVNGEVLKVVRSCLSSGLMFGMCSTSLLWLVLTGMRVGFSKCKVSSILSKSCQVGM